TTTVVSGTPASPETTVVTSSPTVVTTTVKAPATTTLETTAQSEGTTASKETTVLTQTTPGVQVTSGPVTGSTTAIAETSTVVSGTPASPETTVVTSSPTVVTTTVKAPATTTLETTAQSEGTTASKETTVLTQTTPGCYPQCPQSKPFFDEDDMKHTSKSGNHCCYIQSNGCHPIVETTTVVSGTPASPETTVVTSSPTVVTTTVKAPATTTLETTAQSEGTTASKETTVLTQTTPDVCSYCNASCQVNNGETWNINNCTAATCINGTVIEKPTVCPTVQPQVCANGRPATKIYDDSGCCYRLECPCVCNVWSNSHYLTFDGLQYDFKKNCTYYLVKEIHTKYNLTITVKYDCADSNSSFCPRTLTVIYGSNTVVFSQLETSLMNFRVHVNEKRRYPAYSNSILSLTGTDLVVELEIPEISTVVTYTDSSLRIKLPYDLFSGNTEGQCGTCDNLKPNDCRALNGLWYPSCDAEICKILISSSMSIHCPIFFDHAYKTPAIVSQTITIQTCCLCSSLFEPCHRHVPFLSYLKTCTTDNCYGGNDTCSSLEAYATECAKAGVCIDWRNATGGQCKHTCPSDKVYVACGSPVEPTCNESSSMEGCFCSNGTTLFDPVYKTCLPHCDCVGPDGSPKQPGETWTSGCSICECDSDSMSTQCQPVTCPTVPSPTCSEPGQKLANQTVGCCTEQKCECDVNLCPSPITCKLGFQLNVTSGVCCQTYTCVPKGVCVYNQTEYQPGSKVVTKPCQNCYCSQDVDPVTKLNVIKCSPVVCNTNCSKGYEYKTEAVSCCGTCVQKSCILTAPDNKTHVIEVNDTYVPPDDKCVQYTCENVNGHLITKETKTSCPPYNPLDCEPGTETTDQNGCCKSCKVRSVCEVRSEETVIEVNGCKSTALNLTYCSGHCGSSSRYSSAANQIVHDCECCQETKTIQKDTELFCDDGSVVKHAYVAVESCQCIASQCVTPTPKAQRRRR
uniref:Uncharacterized protein n=1 Tax=Tetraodon nigroviridis TaxID=99883 RepID=H3CHD2_TETNG